MFQALGLGLLLGVYVGLLAADIRLKRRLDQHGGGSLPVILKAGSNEYTVKVTQFEEFGPPWENPWRWLKGK